jgi:siroheme decarboxylase
VTALTPLEKRVTGALRNGLAAVSRPYLAAAKEAGCTEDELLATLKGFVERGVVRKVAAVLDARSVGLDGAALVAWHVDEVDVDRVGATLASLTTVTHCYARATVDGWPFNLYTMVHADTEAHVREWADETAKRIGALEYVVLFTLEELKKTPPKYVFEEEA